MRKSGVGVRHLKQRSRQTVAVRHGGLLDGPPGFPGTQPSCYGARELNLRLLPIAQRNVGIPGFVWRHFLGNLDGTHVAGLLDHAFYSEHAVIVGVTDGEAAQAETTWRGVDDGLRLHAARLKRHGHSDGLHRRAWLEGVGHSPVAQLLASQVLTLVRDIARIVGQRQHFASDGVNHNDAARLGLVGNHGIAQLLIGKKLHFAVNAELDVLAFDWRHLLANAFNHAAQPVLDDAS